MPKNGLVSWSTPKTAQAAVKRKRTNPRTRSATRVYGDSTTVVINGITCRSRGALPAA
jgi:hypothetical protein